jgi:hypothetical protein
LPAHLYLAKIVNPQQKDYIFTTSLSHCRVGGVSGCLRLVV